VTRRRLNERYAPVERSAGAFGLRRPACETLGPVWLAHQGRHVGYRRADGGFGVHQTIDAVQEHVDVGGPLDGLILTFEAGQGDAAARRPPPAWIGSKQTWRKASCGSTARSSPTSPMFAASSGMAAGGVC
jgi:hypothetical protein